MKLRTHVLRIPCCETRVASAISIHGHVYQSLDLALMRKTAWMTWRSRYRFGRGSSFNDQWPYGEGSISGRREAQGRGGQGRACERHVSGLRSTPCIDDESARYRYYMTPWALVMV